MKIGVIADDFTGASDIALTLAEGGLRTAQFVGVPEQPSDVEAGVVALKIRTVPAVEAIAQAIAACDWLRAQGAEQIIYKICSTFDSTDEGNIGHVTQALAAHMHAPHVLVCPAFPANGRSVYMGHLFVGDKLLSDSPMKDHPLTPMTDSDLRRVLGQQTAWPVGHIDYTTVSKGKRAIRSALPKDPAMMIVDAITDADLLAIGAAAKGEMLLTGGSGIALGLPANFGAKPRTPDWDPVAGKAVVLSGSCSYATRAQVADFQQTGPSCEITAEAVISGALDASSLADWVIDQSQTPMVYSSADPDVVARAQSDFGRDAVAHKIEGLFSDLAAALADRGIKRMVVAGGETSGAVVTGLQAKVLLIGPKLANGVPALRHADIALALKSGNFGDTDFFRTALQDMENET